MILQRVSPEMAFHWDVGFHVLLDCTAAERTIHVLQSMAGVTCRALKKKRGCAFYLVVFDINKGG